jgi:hypothetical protein
MVNPKMEAIVQNQNLRIFLGFMVSDIKKMVEEKSDRAVHRSVEHRLDWHTLEWLKTALARLEAFRSDLEEEKRGKFVDAGMDKFCNCPFHLRRLKSIGVTHISDLLSVDPFRLQDALHSAELESGDRIREPHLYVGIWLKVRRIAERSARTPHPFL